MVLEGGIALNLFVLDFPRLSVDIGLNYIGAPDRETMLRDRPRVEQALTQAKRSRQHARDRRNLPRRVTNNVTPASILLGVEPRSE